MGSSSPRLPSSFDPAILLHSEAIDVLQDAFSPRVSNSDELEAIQLLEQETTAAKTRDGIVIQHRAWKTAEVFRSEEDHPVVSPSAQRTTPRSTFRPIFNSSDTIIPSSPPLPAKMNFTSSPVVYPPSSSPPHVDKSQLQKRKMPPFANVAAPAEPKKRRTMGGFMADSESESEGEESAPVVEKPIALEFLNNLGKRAISPIDELEEGAPEPAVLSDMTMVEASSPLAKVAIQISSGKSHFLRERLPAPPVPYEKIVAERSFSAVGKAQKSYYGIEIHRLIDQATKEIKEERKKAQEREREKPIPTTETIAPVEPVRKNQHMMWTEKYRARKFTDLVGDERTHRSVLKWLKGWDPIVFPGLARARQQKKKFTAAEAPEERAHRKILMLTGPPGLGKTTLAHVCAKQAGYEILEINASDERSKDVVKGRIRDAVGTENVRGVNVDQGGKTVRKAGRPVCVIVDEVDGVVGGSGSGGEGGFMKALIDLVLLDQKNTADQPQQGVNSQNRKKKKGDNFRLLRPLILICNDVYHPSLRPLRSSSVAEIIHVRKPPLDKIITRVKSVFEKEGFTCESDGVRRLCEATWGLGGRKEGRGDSKGSGEGDIRGVLVAAEWIAHKMRASAGVGNAIRLNKKWLEQNVLNDSTTAESLTRGLGRGGVREIVERVFLDGAGFPNLSLQNDASNAHNADPTSSLSATSIRKRHAMAQLREMVDTAGDFDRCITDCFTNYPTHQYQDDTFLTKPNMAYDWLHFHDLCSSKVFGSQDWELTPYLSHSVLAFHSLFAGGVARHSWNNDTQMNAADANPDVEEHPLSGPRAPFAAFETEKQNRALLTSLLASLPADLLRSFRSPESLAVDLLPSLHRILNPDVRPVVVGGSAGGSVASVRKESEKIIVQNSVRVMAGLGVAFEKVKIENDGPRNNGAAGGWIYRMEPPIDSLSTYHIPKQNPTSTSSSTTAILTQAPTRYATRQILDQELRKELSRRLAEERQARFQQGSNAQDRIEPTATKAAETKESSKTVIDPSTAAAILTKPKRDFFGRIIVNEEKVRNGSNGNDAKKGSGTGKGNGKGDEEGLGSVWVSFHEGFSNAVRRPISMREFLGAL